jgi:sugar lactone lactonase YvrE
LGAAAFLIVTVLLLHGSAAAQNLFVSNYNGGSVSEVTPAGAVSTFATGLPGPNGLAFDAFGNLYVADGNGTVSKVTPGGVVSTFASGFVSLVGAAFDGSGNLYVADYNSGRVAEVTPAGVVSTFAAGFSAPAFLALTVPAIFTSQTTLPAR